MAPGRAVLTKLDRLRAKARKKVRERTSSDTPSADTKPPSKSDAESPVAVQDVVHEPEPEPAAGSDADADALSASLGFPAGTLSTPITLGAATAAGVELLADQSGSGPPVRNRKINQDCFGIKPRFAAVTDAMLAGVYDGHGAQGGEAARVAREIVPQVLEEALKAHMARCGGTLRDALAPEERRRAYVRLFHKAFTEAERTMRDEERGIAHGFSGTTATCLWLDGSDLFVAWAGDSRCILGRRVDGPGSGVEAVDLTWDQTPARSDEKKRVRAAGGRVTRWKKNVGPQRVWLPDEWLPGLAMTRSLGDTILSKHGVVATPEVTVTRLSCEESFVVAASDGVWEFMSSAEVAQFVAEQRDSGASAVAAAKALVGEAMRRWTENETVVDDTTAVVVFVEAHEVMRKNSVLLGRVDSEEKEFENRSLRDIFRPRRVEITRDARIGQPWNVAANGKLEIFAPSNQGEQALVVTTVAEVRENIAGDE